jgi:hypothetical protein
MIANLTDANNVYVVVLNDHSLSVVCKSSHSPSRIKLSSYTPIPTSMS